jgi:hypothetical protein
MGFGGWGLVKGCDDDGRCGLVDGGVVDGV